jgi:hypothetical protein
MRTIVLWSTGALDTLLDVSGPPSEASARGQNQASKQPGQVGAHLAPAHRWSIFSGSALY